MTREQYVRSIASTARAMIARLAYLEAVAAPVPASTETHQ